MSINTTSSGIQKSLGTTNTNSTTKYKAEQHGPKRHVASHNSVLLYLWKQFWSGRNKPGKEMFTLFFLKCKRWAHISLNVSNV